MIKEITNTPVGCQICGAPAYGRESFSNTHEGVIHECIWICSRCGGVAKRHTELERKQNDQTISKTSRTNP